MSRVLAQGLSPHPMTELCSSTSIVVNSGHKVSTVQYSSKAAAYWKLSCFGKQWQKVSKTMKGNYSKSNEVSMAGLFGSILAANRDGERESVCVCV